MAVVALKSTLQIIMRARGNVSAISERETRRMEKFSLLGVEMSPAVAFAVVLSLLGAVALMTALLLVMRSCRLHKQRHQNDLRRNNAQTILLQQRAEEDKYLP
ncbi:hypothetical protein Tcan_14171 [Toxocara canis]|uniref:Uncharacterized protein n=2 Tax=Toxocara canis TaxID=6265 RepID=A0A0B2V0E5_TOXCA|nr:hypothetical protein Tcan_14171 [Toxocara canis]VDM25314.1 unnamed protein product [Toxocara canis]